MGWQQDLARTEDPTNIGGTQNLSQTRDTYVNPLRSGIETLSQGEDIHGDYGNLPPFFEGDPSGMAKIQRPSFDFNKNWGDLKWHQAPLNQEFYPGKHPDWFPRKVPRYHDPGNNTRPIGSTLSYLVDIRNAGGGVDFLGDMDDIYDKNRLFDLPHTPLAPDKMTIWDYKDYMEGLSDEELQQLYSLSSAERLNAFRNNKWWETQNI